MTEKIREYKMNGSLIIGVDAGYGNYKTARRVFPTAITASEKPPVLAKDYIEMDGKYYIIGEGHKGFVADKVMREVIDNFLRTGETDIVEPYASLMKEAATEYADIVFQKLHDYEYNEQMMKLHFIGGGARIIEAYGSYNKDRVFFNHDIRANAKGYEHYCYMIL